MTGDTDRIDRRSVLKTTGAALAGSALAAGSASADVTVRADCGVAKVDTPIAEECGGAYTGDYFQEGDVAKIFDYCTDSSGYQWAFVEPAASLEYDRFTFWVYADDLEPC